MTHDEEPRQPQPRERDLASTLRTVATAVQGDGDREPGDIAAADAGASRLATEIDAAPPGSPAGKTP